MKEKGKKGCSEGCRTSVLAAAGVLLLVFAFFALVPATAQAAVEVRVDAPEYVDVEETSFVATIVVDDVTDFNSAQFDLSFDKSVLEVKGVEDGEIDGETVPIVRWVLNPDKDTVRVVASFAIGEGVSGSGYLAKIEFEVKGEKGEESELNISKVRLYNSSAKKIPANWIGAEIRIGPPEEGDGGDENPPEEGDGGDENDEAPEITAFEPAEAVVSSAEGEPTTFKVTVDQTVEIIWQINGTLVQTNETVTEAAYTNTSAVAGISNVSAVATNPETGLSAVHTWIWNVASTSTLEPGAATPTPTPETEETEGTTPTPTPTLAPGETPLPEEEEATPTKPTATPPSTEEEKKTKARPTPELEEEKTPGFEAVFAIAVVFGVAVAEVLHRGRKK